MWVVPPLGWWGLGTIAKQTEQTSKSKPVSSGLHQIIKDQIEKEKKLR